MTGAGHQIDSQELYELQKLKRTAKVKTAPAIVMAGLSKAENIGAVYRLADAVGSDTVYILESTQPYPDQKTIQRVSRSTVNVIQTVMISEQELKQTLPSLPALVAVEITSESTSILETELPEQCTLVVGNENYGIPKSALELCHSAVHVPMHGINGSMNVTIALAIVLYEWRRQNGS